MIIPDHVGLVAAQATGKLAGLVAESFYGFQYPALEGLAYAGRTIQYMRHSAERNISHLRDLFHVRHSFIPAVNLPLEYTNLWSAPRKRSLDDAGVGSYHRVPN